MPPVSIMLWLPAVFGVLGALAAAFASRGSGAESTGTDADGAEHGRDSAGSWTLPGAVAFVGSLAALGLAIGYIADYKSGGASLQHVTDVVWISSWGSTTSSRSTA